VLERAWKDVAADPSLDEPVPAGWTRDPQAFAVELEHRLGERVRELADLDAEVVAEGEVIRFLSTRPSLLRGALVDSLELETIGDDTIVRRRDGAGCELRGGDDVVLVLLGDRRLEMPSWLEPALRHIRSEPWLRVADLEPELADAASRAVLVRRLVREGLLRPER
jgi:hypothetical protein